MRVIRLMMAALLVATADSVAAQVPQGAASVPGGWSVRDPERTRYFGLTNGIMGGTALASIPRAQGIDWKAMMGGAAYAMRYQPTGGPDCKPRQDDPLLEFFTLEATEGSRLAVNPAAQIGVAFLQGTVTHYVPASDFCASKRYVKKGAGAGYLYMPFAAQGWSPRNFHATALVPSGAVNSAAGGRPLGARVAGTFAGPGLSARLGGYASVEMLGQSQALGEGPGAQVSAAMLDQYAGSGAAAEALKSMPGTVPGKDSKGWLQLSLADRTAESLAGANAAFFYVHVRAVHTTTEVKPGKASEALQDALRTGGEVVYDPAFPNDPRRK